MSAYNIMLYVCLRLGISVCCTEVACTGVQYDSVREYTTAGTPYGQAPVDVFYTAIARPVLSRFLSRICKSCQTIAV